MAVTAETLAQHVPMGSRWQDRNGRIGLVVAKGNPIVGESGLLTLNVDGQGYLQVTADLLYEEWAKMKTESAEPRNTSAGSDLMDFMNHCKLQGLCTARGEFVASDGTRMSYDWSFERGEKKGAREDG